MNGPANLVARYRRALKRAVDLRSMRTISADELMAADPDRYHEIRRTATHGRNEKINVVVCENCGYAVYAPREPRTRPTTWCSWRRWSPCSPALRG